MRTIKVNAEGIVIDPAATRYGFSHLLEKDRLTDTAQGSKDNQRDFVIHEPSNEGQTSKNSYSSNESMLCVEHVAKLPTGQQESSEGKLESAQNPY